MNFQSDFHFILRKTKKNIMIPDANASGKKGGKNAPFKAKTEVLKTHQKVWAV